MRKVYLAPSVVGILAALTTGYGCGDSSDDLGGGGSGATTSGTGALGGTGGSGGTGGDPQPGALAINAGPDQTITAPADSVNLIAMVTGMNAGSASVSWMQTSGAAATLTGTDTPTLSLDGLSVGTYAFEVTATAPGEVATDSVTVTVLDDATTCDGPTFYISPAGSDSTGDGSQGAPWQSLAFATAMVTEPGATIRATAGTFTEVEPSFLAVGVCIEGEGAATVITSSITDEFQAIIVADSVEGTDGHQHISHLVLDGNDLTTWGGISISGRSNFSVHDCTIRNFLDRGVIFNGQEDLANLEPPGIYARGNLFYGNLVENSSRYTSYGTGCLNIGSQEGMLIFGNTITQLDRPQGENGWPIKLTGDGWLRGVKIYENVITKIPFGGQYGGDGGWDFAIELFHVFGLEVYDNEIQGSVDLNWQWQDDDYPFSAWIHNNVIGQPVLNNHPESGIVLEFDSTGVIIEDNIIQNVLIGVSFTPREGDVINAITLQRNVFSNLGMAGAGQGLAGGLLGIFPEAGAPYSIDGFTIQHNTMTADPNNNPHWGIQLENGPSSIDDVVVQNNIAMNFASGWLVTSFPITNLVISHNDAFGNGGDNAPVFTAGAPPGAVIESNISADPLFGSAADHTLQAGSPAVDAGVDIGMSFLGAAPDLGALESH